MAEAISYKISLNKLTKHLLSIECTIQCPHEKGQIVSLPAWVPGSYMIRDFAKHVMAIEAYSHGLPININKIHKNTWQCAPCKGPLIIKYEVYCFDQAARGAYVDNTRVFFDGCRVFLVVEGEEEQTRSVEVIRPEFAKALNWSCATSMTRNIVAEDGFGVYIANNHLELIDHPFEISPFISFEFLVAGVPHWLVVAGSAYADWQRLVNDVQKVCEAQVDFFSELPAMERYVFILSVLNKGYGGIEHRASSSLVCSRSNLPQLDNKAMSDEYKSLLGLFSHEYFHLWNVKRIKPEVFLNPNLQSEVYTRQLWIFEGITSYFDNLNLVRANIFTEKDYLEILQLDINQYLQSPGANLQTLSDASFDAWIKYYQPDENSVNSSISYYVKGSLAALALDLLIIKNSKRKQSLADIMQVLWQQYGKTGLGLPENYFEHVVFEVTGEDYNKFFEMAIRSTDPLELSELLLDVGVICKPKEPSVLDNIGIKLSGDQSKLVVRSILTNSAAEQAGLSPNDVLIAINGFAINNGNLEATIASIPVNSVIKLHVFRNDILLELSLLNPSISKSVFDLELSENLSDVQLLNRNKWLGV
jgi:predicted metalloprotease with PDZ domain